MGLILHSRRLVACIICHVAVSTLSFADTVFDQGPYVSDYLMLCTGTDTFAAFRTACQAAGDGYDIGTIPTAAASAVVAGMIQGTAWIGITDAVTEGTWLYVAGRLQGQTYYLADTTTCPSAVYNPFGVASTTLAGNCNWNAGEPNNGGGGGAENCVQYFLSGSSGLLNDVPCTTLASAIGCALCERSPCKIGADCHPTNTLSVSSGYYPNCVCSCKDGFWGDKCQNAIINNGPYVSYYMATCSSAYYTWAAGQEACKSQGTGWDLATTPTLAAQAAVGSIALTGGLGWVGISDGVTEGTWKYVAGRLAGYTYYTGGACAVSTFIDPLGVANTTFSYCLWNTGEPNDGASDTVSENCGEVLQYADGRLNDAPCDYTGIYCAMCERSPCKLGTDCHPNNTLAMDGGYFPNCVCVCKSGYWGTLCEKKYRDTVNHGPYTSDYLVNCSSSGMNYDAARTYCRSLGQGWDVATLPSSAARVAIQAMYPATTTSYRSWVAVSDEVSEGIWKYTAGRLTNLTYSINSTCVTNVLNPFGVSSSTFSYCGWKSGEPNNDAGGENCAVTVPASDSLLNDIPCAYASNYCQICERSPCLLGLDCHPNNTLVMSSGYYPDCVCTCKTGYIGSKCEIAVVDQGPFESNYVLTCPVNGGVTFDGGRLACQTLGEGWDIATATTVNAQTTIDSMSSSFASWVGLSDSQTEGVWKYAAGRFQGLTYSIGSICQTTILNPYRVNRTVFSYCHWDANMPSSSIGSNCGLSDGSGMKDEICSSTLPCALCERSRCELGVDCHPLNTLIMTGSFYPNCKCTCNPGAGGDKCQYPYASPTSTQSTTFTRVATVTLSYSITRTQSASLAISSTLTLRSSLSVSRSSSKSATQSVDASHSMLLWQSTSASMSPSFTVSSTASTRISSTKFIAVTITTSFSASRSHQSSNTSTVSLLSIQTESMAISGSESFYATITATGIATITLAPTKTVTPSISLHIPETYTTSNTIEVLSISVLSKTDTIVVSDSINPSDNLSSSIAIIDNGSHSSSIGGSNISDSQTLVGVGASTSISMVVSSSGYFPLNESNASSTVSIGQLSSASNKDSNVTHSDTLPEEGHITGATSAAITVPSTTAPQAYNAPNEDPAINALLNSAAASLPVTISFGIDKCLRMEQILSNHAVLSPFRFAADSYEMVLVVNGLVVAGSMLLGAVTTLPHWLYRKATRGISEDTGVMKAAEIVRFPGTAIQIFITVAHGASVAAGLSIAQHDDNGDGYAAVVLLVAIPIVWAVMVAKMCGGRAVEFSLPPANAEGSTLLLCAGVRPRRFAKLLGPVVADLRDQRIAAPVIPMIVPWLLFLVSVVVATIASCEYVPLVVGIVYALYAVGIAIVRPYLGWHHNIVEACMAMVAAACLIVYFTVIRDDTPSDAGLTSSEVAPITILVALSNIRIPFALARALDVTFPKVVSIVKVPPAADELDLPSPLSGSVEDALGGVVELPMFDEGEEDSSTEVVMMIEAEPIESMDANEQSLYATFSEEFVL